ncbi:MAG: ATP-grasp domain-containing protein [Gaiellales bacterium]
MTTAPADARVLVTAAGAPGCPRLIRALREAGYSVVGTDMNPRSAAAYQCDAFAQVPRGDDPGFIPAMRDVAREMQADVVFPTSSSEVVAWAHARDSFGIPVMVGPADGVEAASDKAATFRLADRLGIPHPRTIEVADADSLAAAVRELGYPHRQVVIKPSQAKGSRGMRVLTAGASRRDALLHLRPGEHAPETLESVLEVFATGPFPSYVVQEHLDGPEETVDAICWRGDMLLPMTRTREAIRAGLAMDFTLIDRPREEAYSATLAEALGSDYFLSVQFKGGKLMEINPRVSTIVYAPDINPPALAAGLALGQCDPQAVRALRARVPIGRRAIRYFDQSEHG